ncbi:HNH endonuclease [Mucilaginibacter sp.]|uniref:HNH endonuclease n=1 Tax=Mucilaginibacter sp. TaxID=1882438 RepID=UPI0028522816|nr:HNH endonuclease [Mucilaginibacter sp.]MDR3695506.1 HNH endonuclease [Mucilaginibacter sp.]
MEINVSFNDLKIGKFYDRNFLTELWGYKGRQAISKGVVTPANSNSIVLFVTKEKQRSLTQYEDYISDDYLYWEGEEKGGNNDRIINATKNHHPIHLFYRYRHHAEFKYMGIIKLASFIEKTNAPFKFIFNIASETIARPETFDEPEFLYGNRETERLSTSLSRIGQGKFRVDLLDLWDACSITDVKVPEILKASHIKPWKESNNFERLDPYNGLVLTPTLDTLFDRGFISFENKGQIIISKEIESYSKILNISPDMKLRKQFESNGHYLEYHRDEVYLKRFKSHL